MGERVFFSVCFALLGLCVWYGWEHRNDPPPPPPVPWVVTVAADWTTLWAVREAGKVVYFSRAGTSHDETTMSGKMSKTERIVTPNAD